MLPLRRGIWFTSVVLTAAAGVLSGARIVIDGEVGSAALGLVAVAIGAAGAYAFLILSIAMTLPGVYFYERGTSYLLYVFAAGGAGSLTGLIVLWIWGVSFAVQYVIKEAGLIHALASYFIVTCPWILVSWKERKGIAEGASLVSLVSSQLGSMAIFAHLMGASTRLAAIALSAVIVATFAVLLRVYLSIDKAVDRDLLRIGQIS